MNNIPIFVDLDETLIHSTYPVTRPADDAVRVRAGNEDYDVILRNGARQLLKMLRNRGQVHMLSTYWYVLKLLACIDIEILKYVLVCIDMYLLVLDK